MSPGVGLRACRPHCGNRPRPRPCSSRKLCRKSSSTAGASSWLRCPHAGSTASRGPTAPSRSASLHRVGPGAAGGVALQARAACDLLLALHAPAYCGRVIEAQSSKLKLSPLARCYKGQPRAALYHPDTSELTSRGSALTGQPRRAARRDRSPQWQSTPAGWPLLLRRAVGGAPTSGCYYAPWRPAGGRG